jgi:hypothetical protein
VKSVLYDRHMVSHACDQRQIDLYKGNENL